MSDLIDFLKSEKLGEDSALGKEPINFGEASYSTPQPEQETPEPEYTGNVPEEDQHIKDDLPDGSDPSVKGFQPTNRWSDVPSFPGALLEGRGRYKDVQAMFLDLANPDDMKTYNMWLARSRGPMANCFLREEKREFDWKVLLIVERFEFQVYLPLERRNG